MQTLLSKVRPKKMDGRSQPLNTKDAQAFQLALTLYEKREYEKALAEVDQILRRRKDKVHGESLSLKALLLHHLKRDGDDVARLMAEGTAADAKSHVAWHMAGIYHKLRKEYAAAYRAYLASYRINRDNQNVHQDLAMLAAHQRDFATLVEVRRQILGARMSLRMAWTSLAAAQFLAKDYVGVTKTVDLFDQVMALERAAKPKAPAKAKAAPKAEPEKEKKKKGKKGKKGADQNEKASANAAAAAASTSTGKGKSKSKDPMAAANAAAAAATAPTDDDAATNEDGKTPQDLLNDEIETSEMLMLAAQSLLAQGSYQKALEFLAKNKTRVLDRAAWLEARAAALAHIDAQQARSQYIELLDRNSEQVAYYEALEALSSDKQELYAMLQKRYPKSLIATSRPLALFVPPLEGGAGATASSEVSTTSSEASTTSTDASELLVLADYDARLHAFLKHNLDRGVPSTFELVAPLYAEPRREAAVRRVVAQLAPEGPTDGKGAAAATVNVFLARHLVATGELARAVALVEATIAAYVPPARGDGSDGNETSEVDDLEIDLQLVLADLRAQQGDLAASAALRAATSERIPRERSLNTTAALAAYRANDIEGGNRLAFAFARWGKYAETDAEALKHVVTMESVDVVTALAAAHVRRREHGLALKRAQQVLELFDLYREEEYDFHYYGPRRATLREYAGLVQWEDVLYRHPAYLAALEIAADEWIAQSRGESDGRSEKEVAAAKRQRAAQLEGLDLKEDDDPFGIALLENKAGLDKAFAAWQKIDTSPATSSNTATSTGPNPLTNTNSPSGSIAGPVSAACAVLAGRDLVVRTAWLGFRLFLAQKKYVLANQALKKARDAGLSASRLAVGGLMAKHTLEHDEAAPAVLRTLQLKLLPTVVAAGDVVGTPAEAYADEFVTDVVDWTRVRRFVGATAGLDAALAPRLAELAATGRADSAAVAEAVWLEARRVPGDHTALEAQIAELWPQQTFIAK